MNWMNEIWVHVAEYINAPYLLSFVLLSYFVKRYFGALLLRLTKTKWRTVYTVLFFATLFAVPFLIWTDASWVKILFSYTLGTSLHELIFKYLSKLSNK